MTRQSHTDHKGTVDYEAMEWEEHLALSVATDAEHLAAHNLTLDDTAILAMAEDRKRINVLVDTDEEVGRNAERETEITEALPDMPAATPAGIRLKVEILDYLVQWYHEPTLNQRFVASILGDLDRMAGVSSLMDR